MTTNCRVINWTLTTNLGNGETWTISNLDNDKKLRQWQKIWTATKNWPMKTNLVKKKIWKISKKEHDKKT